MEEKKLMDENSEIMTEQQQQQQMQQKNQGQKQLLNFSVVLSFCVAFFAIFSLAVFGVVSNQSTGVTYAADTPNMGATFVLKTQDYMISPSSDYSGGSAFSTPFFYVQGSSGSPIFCVQHAVEYGEDVTYSKSDEIEDYGLLYLLNKDIPTPAGVSTTVQGAAEDVKAWIKQVSIWTYLAKKYTGNSAIIRNGVISSSSGQVVSNLNVNEYSYADLKALQVKKLVRKTGTETEIFSSSQSLYDTVIEPLVNEAMAQSRDKILSVSISSEDISLTEDKKYYQTGLVSVVGNGLEHYDVSITGVDGAFLVKENGEELSKNDIAPATKFYVRVPVDKIDQAKKKLGVNVAGTFSMLQGHYYDATREAAVGVQEGSYQRVITVTGSTKVIGSGLEITIVGSPDTGMNNAQTIYFIGLIILLCGVGIVYANAKPVEQKQQQN